MSQAGCQIKGRVKTNAQPLKVPSFYRGASLSVISRIRCSRRQFTIHSTLLCHIWWPLELNFGAYIFFGRSLDCLIFWGVWMWSVRTQQQARPRMAFRKWSWHTVFLNAHIFSFFQCSDRNGNTLWTDYTFDLFSLIITSAPKGGRGANCFATFLCCYEGNHILWDG